MSKLVFSEIFQSIQGEGKYTGVPSIFFRTVGCNLRCVWCDSKYSLMPSPTDLTFESPEMVLEYMYNQFGNIKHIVITGGEPLLFSKNPVFTTFLKQLQQHNHFVTIETNATITIPKTYNLIVDLWSISPKLLNSFPIDQLQPEYAIHQKNSKLIFLAIKNYINSETDYQIKFVVDNPETDMPEILKFIETFSIPKEHVYLMPEGKTEKEQISKSNKIVEICKQYSFNFCPRLHILLWGTKRGV